MSKASFFNGATILFILASIVTMILATSGEKVYIIAMVISIPVTILLFMLTNYFDKKERHAFKMKLKKRYNH